MPLRKPEIPFRIQASRNRATRTQIHCRISLPISGFIPRPVFPFLSAYPPMDGRRVCYVLRVRIQGIKYICHLIPASIALFSRGTRQKCFAQCLYAALMKLVSAGLIVTCPDSKFSKIHLVRARVDGCERYTRCCCCCQIYEKDNSIVYHGTCPLTVLFNRLQELMTGNMSPLP